jgi:hypothetical protein
VGADGDQPGVWRNLADRGALAFARRPAHRVGQLVTGPGGQRVQAGDQPVAGTGPHHRSPSAAASWAVVRLARERACPSRIA